MSDNKSLVVIPNKLPALKKIDQHIMRCHFVNTEVKLDRVSYRKCEFDNVVFLYNGGPMEFIDNEVRGFQIRSDNAEINAMFHLLKEFGVLGND